MNNEDHGTASGNTGDINEVNVVVCNDHDGVVIRGSETSGFLVYPWNGRAVSRLEESHIEREELSVGQGVCKCCSQN